MVDRAVITQQMMTASLVVAANILIPAPSTAQGTAPENLLSQLPETTEVERATEAEAEAEAENTGAENTGAENTGAAAANNEVQRFLSDPVIQAIDAMAEPDVPETQVWSLDHARALAAIIEGISTEGLDPDDYNLRGLREAIALGANTHLNALASKSFRFLVEDLRDGRTPMNARKQWFVFDPDSDRYPTEVLMAEALANGDLAGVLAKITPQHPDYFRLKQELEHTEVGTSRHKLIRVNMDRWRWLARDLGSRYLMTNVPEYQLRLTINNKIIRTYRTVVGKPGRTATPQIAESVEGVIFNPTWTVPQSIVKGEGLGARVLGNPAWARRAGYKATTNANGWVSVVQQPGPGNSLGLMKLDMPNRHAIFFHDTPSRHLFKNTRRALSHGCIRTERATELAMTLAIMQGGLTASQSVAKLKSGKYTRVRFTKTIPAYITYFTMAQNIDGDLTTFADVYGRDAAVLSSFDKPRVPNRKRVTGEQVIPIENDPRSIT